MKKLHELTLPELQERFRKELRRYERRGEEPSLDDEKKSLLELISDEINARLKGENA